MLICNTKQVSELESTARVYSRIATNIMDMDMDMFLMFSEGFSNEQHEERAISEYPRALDSTGSNEVEGDSDEATSRYRNIEGKEDSSQLEGVVSLKNGHWGAQIWLGTFKTREEALKAYHAAHVKFTGKYNAHHRHNQDIIPGGPMMVKSLEWIKVDLNTDQKHRNHFHGSVHLGKRKAMEDESENKSDDAVKLFGIAIGTKPKAKKGMGIQIESERKRIARWRTRN
ncbi:hypothetical protein SUGI_1010920 [Cryptomeria japonica]|nr:hypothetical protein SUGI_1010920 [Cryptomeria japonica]